MTEKKEKIERQHVLLKNGTTVAIDDYDEKIHGKAQEENDDQYMSRINARPSGQPVAGVTPRTTIPNLRTYDSKAGESVNDGKPVATTDDADVEEARAEKTTAKQAAHAPAHKTSDTK